MHPITLYDEHRAVTGQNGIENRKLIPVPPRLRRQFGPGRGGSRLQSGRITSICYRIALRMKRRNLREWCKKELNYLHVLRPHIYLSFGKACPFFSTTLLIARKWTNDQYTKSPFIWYPGWDSDG
jgi:hypothetical protein